MIADMGGRRTALAAARVFASLLAEKWREGPVRSRPCRVHVRTDAVDARGNYVYRRHHLSLERV